MLTSPVARPDEAQPPPPTEPQEGQPAPSLTPRPKSQLELLLLEEKPQERPADPEVAATAERRQAFLSVHQAAGIATWALMATTVVVGQLNYRDLYGNGGGTQRYQTGHRALAAATTATFAFTGVLALSAPAPDEKKPRRPGPTVHEVAMAATTAGLVAEIALGIWAHDSPSTLNQRDLANAHQGVGYATLAAMTVGAITLVF